MEINAFMFSLLDKESNKVLFLSDYNNQNKYKINCLFNSNLLCPVCSNYSFDDQLKHRYTEIIFKEDCKGSMSLCNNFNLSLALERFVLQFINENINIYSLIMFSIDNRYLDIKYNNFKLTTILDSEKLHFKNEQIKVCDVFKVRLNLNKASNGVTANVNDFISSHLSKLEITKSKYKVLKVNMKENYNYQFNL